MQSNRSWLKKLAFILLLISLSTLFLNLFMRPSYALGPVFDEIFVSDSHYDKLYISYEIIVWHTGHVEVYATYCYYDSNPSKCAFYYLRVQTSILDCIDYGTNLNIPEYAPNTYQEGYVDNLNPNVDYWINDGCLMNIAVQMKFNSFDYEKVHYATIQMMLLYRPTGAIGLLSSIYIVISNTPVMPSPDY
ncbi:MAG: hypothetical protein ACTSYD_01095 [Candidatus Heimdallarchaeaceae archaeon]